MPKHWRSRPVQCVAKSFKNILPLSCDHTQIWLRHLCWQFVSLELQGSSATGMKTHPLWCLIWSCELSVDEALWNATWSLEIGFVACCRTCIFTNVIIFLINTDGYVIIATVTCSNWRHLKEGVSWLWRNAIRPQPFKCLSIKMDLQSNYHMTVIAAFWLLTFPL